MIIDKKMTPTLNWIDMCICNVINELVYSPDRRVHIICSMPKIKPDPYFLN